MTKEVNAIQLWAADARRYSLARGLVRRGDPPDRRDGVTMKCQRCEKGATFHITELTGEQPHELHLCEDHAREYLTQSDETEVTALPRW